MTKHGTKSIQKAEMTPEEFAARYGAEKIRLYLDEEEHQIKGKPIIKDGFMPDLRSVIRGELIRFYIHSHWVPMRNVTRADFEQDDVHMSLIEKYVDEFLNNNQ